jgi:hypothetical protein
MGSEAKFRFSVGGSLLELEGSEEFVSKQINDLSKVIENISANGFGTVSQLKEPPSDEKHTEKTIDSPTEPVKTEKTEQATDETIASYPHVYSEIGGMLKISTKFPGDTNLKKMSNAALIYCYGKKLMGKEPIPHTEIRKVCEDHGILDKSNFAKIFNNKDLFVTDGKKGGNKNVKLAYKGIEGTKQLIKQIK